MRILEKHKEKILILALALLALDIVVWRGVLASSAETRFLFLDVGQGDSELVEFPAGGGQAGGVQLLIDGGPPTGAVLRELGRALAPTDRYIDLVLMTHPQEDHFGGLIEVLRQYDVGAFLSSGRSRDTDAYRELIRVIEERGIRMVELGAGDRIRTSGGTVRILSPTPDLLRSDDLNDTTLVARVESGGVSALFTGDAGAPVERTLVRAGVSPVDILKVGHHGSKFSSSEEFLRALRPAVAVIEVGKNSYGHPTSETLARLRAAGAAIFRTDERGTIEVRLGGLGLQVFTAR
ncbi:MAG: MBL fold metallo-hydrolase [bacterium]|nr:MBL fold metallo-hydrolase [bacterium]